MNILPKKRWHVRTKENIARVRKDEAEAAEKERQEKLRIDTATREARLNLLKQKSKEKLSKLCIEVSANREESDVTSKHIDIFNDFEHAVQTTNREHEKEAKDKKEEYEKKIGYLTYLGQDTNEALGKKNWYELPPETSRYARAENVKDTYEKLVLKDEDGKQKKRKLDEKDGEICWKSKQYQDPFNSFKSINKKQFQDNHQRFESTKASSNTVEQKNITNRKDESKKSLQQLREARLKREQQEKFKTEMFLKKLSGGDTTHKEKEPERIKPKYNSQFNPELARQNYR